MKRLVRLFVWSRISLWFVCCSVAVYACATGQCRVVPEYAPGVSKKVR